MIPAIVPPIRTVATIPAIILVTTPFEAAPAPVLTASAAVLEVPPFILPLSAGCPEKSFSASAEALPDCIDRNSMSAFGRSAAYASWLLRSSSKNGIGARL